MRERFITVKGTGQVSAPPDMIVLILDLDSRSFEYRDTMDLAANELDMLRKAIASSGHDLLDLKTTRFDVGTSYKRVYDENHNSQNVFEGYSCTHRMRLEFAYDVKLLDETLTQLSISGVDPEIDISFIIKDKDTLKDKLLENAIANAMSKAELLAKASGVKLGDILQINYSWGEIHFQSEIVYSPLMPMSQESSRPTMDINPEDIEETDTVTVIWEILPV